jgi:regulator of sigma E protease
MEILISFIIPFIVLLTVVVFIHEYGHYYFAKKFGVGVTDFSIGFGKELFGFNDKSGTRWKFCAIPLGGYVKFFGDRNVFSQAEQEELLKEYNAEDQKKLFVVKPIYQRSLIVAGGPFANFLLAILIFSFIYMFAGKDFTPAQIQEVQKDSPAYVAGIKNGDIISSIDNKKVSSIMEVSTFINTSTRDKLSIEVLRNEQSIVFLLTPK